MTERVVMTGKDMAANAKAMYGQAKTESGHEITGLVHGRYPWIFWDARAEYSACERCGAKEALSPGGAIATAKDLVEWARKLVPFGERHSACYKRAQPDTF